MVHKILENYCKCCHGHNVYCCRTNGSNFLLHCLDCGAYFFTPSPTSDELRSYYETTYSKVHQQQLFELLRKNYESGFYKNEVNSIKFYLGENKIDSMKLLDYGCGYGFFLKSAKELGHQPWGIEYDQMVSKYNETEFGIKMIDNADLHEFPNDSFDVIRANHSVEHLPNPEETISILFEKLRKDGILLISSPCFSPTIVQSNSIKLYDLVYPEHLFYFSNKSLQKLLEKIGFNVEINITQFANNEQALRLLGINQNYLSVNKSFNSESFDELKHNLEDKPFFAGANLFVVARKKGNTNTKIKNTLQSTNMGEMKIHPLTRYFIVQLDDLSNFREERTENQNTNGRGVHCDIDLKNSLKWNLLFPFTKDELSNKIYISGNILNLNANNMEINLLNEQMQLVKCDGVLIEKNEMNSFVIENKHDFSGTSYVDISGNGRAEFFIYDFIVTEAKF